MVLSQKCKHYFIPANINELAVTLVHVHVTIACGSHFSTNASADLIQYKQEVQGPSHSRARANTTQYHPASKVNLRLTSEEFPWGVSKLQANYATRASILNACIPSDLL